MSSQSLSIEQARQIALVAQGLRKDLPRIGTGDRRQLKAEIARLNLLQIDSVNVLIRSHYLPLYTRLGPYDRSRLDSLTHEPGRYRSCFEYWAHEASFLPMEMHHLLRWRMADARAGIGLYGSLRRFAKEKPNYLKLVLRRLEADGPLTARAIAGPGKRTGPWWGWHDGKIALEYLFWTGQVTASTRSGFERVYDLPERVITAAELHRPDPTRADAIRALVTRATLTLGVGTEADLRDYFRLPVTDTRKALAELIEDRTLEAVTVARWTHKAYLPTGTKLPRSAFNGTTLVSPFDPLMWNRPRVKKLFDFSYRLELYTPAPKRQHGYYVLPVLWRGTFAARLCLKADRAKGQLRINAAWMEPGNPAPELAEGIASELRTLASWLCLEDVECTLKGNLSRHLAAALA